VPGAVVRGDLGAAEEGCDREGELINKGKQCRDAGFYTASMGKESGNSMTYTWVIMGHCVALIQFIPTIARVLLFLKCHRCRWCEKEWKQTDI
jgi:hypothetical protein